jgi:hypothetical protein
MEKGFSARTHGLSWIPGEKMKHNAFIDKDLNEAGLKQYFPSRATYDLSYHCPNCKIYIVDYSQPYSRAQANELVGSM